MRLRLILHVFEGDPTPPTPHIETREIDFDGEQVNPLLLRADKPEGGYIYLFSQEKMDGGTAVYHPFATSPKLPFLEDLPKFGWRKMG